ncbi:MAG: hypothetical protein KBS41_00745, partial [Oscillospiraceae bacterium]|nr:hypothetical protein [Candidatus Equicaccousia limihippi]
MSCARKIKVMFYGIMKKWRYCVAFVIAFAILLTAFAFIKEVKKTGESEEVIAENTELKNIAEAKLKDYQDQKEEYIKKAENAKKIIAATDNVEISEALFNIGVIGGSNEESRQTELEEIQYIYYAAINNIALYDDIAKENNLDVPSTVLRTIVRQDYKNSSLIVSCKGLTKELNDKIRDRVADVVIKTGEKLNAVEKTHSLDLISKTSANVYGEVYSTVQKQINTELDAMDESIKTQQGAVNAYTNTVNDATKINFKKVI